MTSECDTTKCMDDEIPTISESAPTIVPFHVYKINFEQVFINFIKIKSVTIKNPKLNETAEYSIVRNSRVNPIYQVFNLNKYHGYSNPQNDIELKIKFQPNVPFLDFMERFEIWFGVNTLAILLCFGTCVAPIIETNSTDLYFFKNNANTFCMQSIILTNKSEVPAIFEFDAEEDQEIFAVQKPVMGKIGGHSKHKIFFQFKPKRMGMYAMRLSCLICYHEPIIINLFGIYSQTNYSQKDIKYYPFPETELNGYSGYFRDVKELKTYVPPISLSQTFINFGGVNLSQNRDNFTTETFCITNHLKNGVRVEWLSEGKIFIVNPGSISIPPCESMSFECRFKPCSPGRMYAKTLRAQIFWNYDEDPKSISVPLTETVRVVGHSFTESEIIAKARVDPSVIVLPPCIPSQTVATTFIIENTGTIPVMFKFVPPKYTNILLKPRIGVIVNQKLVAIQFQIHEMEQQTCIEQWTLILNDNCEKYLPVYLKVECGLPDITVDQNNIVNFETVHEGTRTSKMIQIKNNTIYKLGYEFKLDNAGFFNVDPIAGTLNPYNETTVKMSYSAVTCSKSKCKERVVVYLANNRFQLHQFFHSFYVFAEKEKTNLFACPSDLKLGKITCGYEVDFNFKLNNFGKSPIHYKLFVVESKVLSQDENKHDTFTITPNSGTIYPKGLHVVRVQGTARAVGENSIKIAYINKFDEYSPLFGTLEVVTVFHLTYSCCYTTVEFTEIIEHNFGKLITKKHLWEMLQINQINSLIYSCRMGELKEVHAVLPEMVKSYTPLWVIFSVKNESSPKLPIKVTRKKNCDCKMENSASLTRWVKKYNCPHREMLSIDYQINPVDELDYCTFNVKFHVEDENMLSFYLNVPEDRRILVNFKMVAVPMDTHFISFYKNYHIQLLDTYIGDKNSILQLHWLYNSTPVDISYTFDVSVIKELCNKEGFHVLELYNYEGLIPHDSRYSLHIRFQPIEVKKYEVSLSGIMGNENVTLKITGHGTKELSKPQTIDTSMPEICSTDPIKNQICLSRDYMIVEIFPIWCNVYKMIFIRNTSKEHVFYYEFKDIIHTPFIELKVEENKQGFLKPKQTQNIIVTIKSFQEAICSDVILYCSVVNMSDVYLHEHYKNTSNSSLTDHDSILTDDSSAPLPYTLTLHLYIHTISSLDKDLYLSTDAQLKYIKGTHITVDPLILTPSVSFSSYFSTKVDNIIVLDKRHTEGILRKSIETMIGTVVFSNMFRKLLELSIDQKPPIYKSVRNPFAYTHGNTSDLTKLHHRDAADILSRPKIFELAKCFQTVMNDMFTDTYNFKHISSVEECMTEIEKFIGKYSECDKSCACKKKH